MAQKEISRKRNHAMDLLRILAALMVLIVHTGQTAGLDKQTAVGGNGVLLFFIISGYLAVRSLSFQPDWRSYYLGRIRRILPLYWLVLTARFIFDASTYFFKGMSFSQIFAWDGPCGPRYLRYIFLLQMWLPSDSWAWWNNRNALWTMSAFAFFYLLAPWLHRLFLTAGSHFHKSCFWSSFLLLCLLLGGKGLLGGVLENALNSFPAGTVDNISEFSAKTPLMELYAFMFGVCLYYAIKENHDLLFGGFCLLLPMAFGFEKMAFEGVFTVLILLAVRLGETVQIGVPAQRAIQFLSSCSFFLYLSHPMLLALFPVLRQGTDLINWTYFFMLLVTSLVASCLIYRLLIRRFEDHWLKKC